LRAIPTVRFDHWRGRSVGGFRFPRGSVTHGFFWTRRRYSLYRMRGPDRRLIADRYDIVEDVRISEREVSYLDLLLDIWVAPGGAAQIEDEDEVLDHAHRGLLSGGQRSLIEETKALVLRRHHAIASEAEALLREATV
jgi:predicted RNA-binding protein associated with RNAse of E/G family